MRNEYNDEYSCVVGHDGSAVWGRGMDDVKWWK